LFKERKVGEIYKGNYMGQTLIIKITEIKNESDSFRRFYIAEILKGNDNNFIAFREVSYFDLSLEPYKNEEKENNNE
jgi:hypothetical protein